MILLMHVSICISKIHILMPLPKVLKNFLGRVLPSSSSTDTCSSLTSSHPNGTSSNALWTSLTTSRSSQRHQKVGVARLIPCWDLGDNVSKPFSESLMSSQSFPVLTSLRLQKTGAHESRIIAPLTARGNSENVEVSPTLLPKLPSISSLPLRKKVGDRSEKSLGTLPRGKLGSQVASSVLRFSRFHGVGRSNWFLRLWGWTSFYISNIQCWPIRTTIVPLGSGRP